MSKGKQPLKLPVVETAAEFLRKRAGNAKGDKLAAFLKKAPANPPQSEDALR